MKENEFELSAYQNFLIVLGYLAQNNIDDNAVVRQSLYNLLQTAQLGENPFRSYNQNKKEEK